MVSAEGLLGAARLARSLRPGPPSLRDVVEPDSSSCAYRTRRMR